MFVQGRFSGHTIALVMGQKLFAPFDTLMAHQSVSIKQDGSRLWGEAHLVSHIVQNVSRNGDCRSFVQAANFGHYSSE